jgi:DNA repair protein RadC
MKKVLELNIEDRPRERLLARGPKALTDQELMAIVLGSGGPKNDLFSLADQIIGLVDTNNLHLTVDQLTTISGIGLAKACSILAAIEFARRRIATDGHKIRQPSDIIPLVQHLADRKQETFICVSLNGAHEVIATRIVTIGLANLCQVHPREVFAEPLVDRACAVIVAHNHPSGELTPSSEDYSVTERLKSAATILGIKFLDHIIFSKRGYFSITERHVAALSANQD